MNSDWKIWLTVLLIGGAQETDNLAILEVFTFTAR